MSRIGKLPITIPDKVDVSYKDNVVFVKGPKGQLELAFRPEVSVETENNTIIVKRKNNAKICKSMHGLYRMLINNMVIGVAVGFQKKLEIIGTGYRASVEGKKLILNIGYSYPYTFDIPESVNIKVENNTNVIIEGTDKQLIGEVAAKIRKMRPPEPYKGKGIKYSDEVVRRKAGKTS